MKHIYVGLDSNSLGIAFMSVSIYESIAPYPSQSLTTQTFIRVHCLAAVEASCFLTSKSFNKTLDQVPSSSANCSSSMRKGSAKGSIKLMEVILLL